MWGSSVGKSVTVETLCDYKSVLIFSRNRRIIDYILIPTKNVNHDLLMYISVLIREAGNV